MLPHEDYPYRVGPALYETILVGFCLLSGPALIVLFLVYLARG